MEQWNRILKPVDDLTKRVVELVIGVSQFNDSFTHCYNGDAIGTMAAHTIYGDFRKAWVVNLCIYIFKEHLLGGREHAIYSINNQKEFPNPKLHMNADVDMLEELEGITRKPIIIFKDKANFYVNWVEMK